MSTVPATPLVRQLAATHGVDLASVRGTGAGGRVTRTDVLAAAGVPAGRTAPTAASSAAVAARVMTFPSWFASGVEVSYDVYARNPLVEDMRQAVPGPYAEALRARGVPPTLFAAGDTPPFTASGIDPTALLQVPWTARHAIAAEANGAKAYATFQRALTDVDFAAALSGWDGPNAAYRRRLEEWLYGDAGYHPMPSGVVR